MKKYKAKFNQDLFIFKKRIKYKYIKHIKEEIQKVASKVTLKEPPKPKALGAEISIKRSAENLEKQLYKIEMTENQLQSNIFNELSHQLADTQNAMAHIHVHLEMLHLLHALECEFKNQDLSK